VNDFKDRDDYGAKLQHSRRLIPALRRIAGVVLPNYAKSLEEIEDLLDLEILERCAEDHLRAYPKHWERLEEYRSISRRLVTQRAMFCDGLLESLRGEFRNEGIRESSKQSKYRSFVGSNIPLLICSQLVYSSPRQLILDEEKVWFGDSLVAKGSHLFERIEKFIEQETKDGPNIEAARRIRENETEAIRVRQGLEIEMRKLILRIKYGETLLGDCDTCPRIYFSNR
jgi:hypothetical protein